MCRLRRAPTRGAAASSQPESGDRGGDRADDEDHEAGIFVDDAAEAEGGDGTLSDSHWSIADSGSARDSEEGEEELGGASAESGRRTQARTRQPARSAATPPRAAARKPGLRKASAAELRAFPVFVRGTLAVTRDAEVKLRALGKKATNDELASRDQSLFGIYEWLAKSSDTPPAPFQRAIQELPGATCKKGAGGYNVWRAFKVEEGLGELGALLETAEMQAVLSEHHKATLERSPAEKRQLVQAFAAKLTALKKACSDLAGRTAAAADRHRSAQEAHFASRIKPNLPFVNRSSLPFNPINLIKIGSRLSCNG
mmetsp:Transcript_73138/g.145452  ORF Transcript_73138/g.145452 Transcript_73138/m.145452 type:complete len:313 (-) Transcript_73138:26-964(-)